MRNFRNYDVWKLSHELTIEVYKLTASFPSDEKYSLTSQMRWAVSSIPANIAEGCGRESDKDFNRFLHISLGSAHELEYYFILARDLNILESNEAQAFGDKINDIKRKLFTLSKKLN